MDIFFGNEFGANAVWFNDGTGTFTDSGQNLGELGSYYGTTLGDFDGDGHLDLFVGTRAGPVNQIWLNDGGGTFTLTLTQTHSVNTFHADLGDLDNDGDLDVFLSNGGFFGATPNTVWFWEVFPAPEMDIQGNGQSIPSGSTTTGTADSTDFGTILLGATPVTHTFTISNGGTADLTISGATLSSGTAFTLTQPASPVISMTTTTFEVTFDPAADGTFTDTISITNNDSDENPYTFVISGTAIIVPEIDVQGNGQSIPNGSTATSTANNTDFGSVLLGTTAVTHTFTISNSGTADLILSGVTLSNGTAFTITQPASPVNSQATTTFDITFDPAAGGTLTDTVTITNNDSDENPYTFVVSGIGIVPAPEIDVQGSGQSIPSGSTTTSTANLTNFSLVNVGVIRTHSFDISNSGTADLTISGASLSNGTAFTITQPTSPVNSQATTFFDISFIPEASGTFTDTVTITSNDSDESLYTFVVSGVGFVPTPEIDVQGNGQSIPDGSTTTSTANNTDFGSVNVGEPPVTYTFTISNSGTANLTLSGASLTDGTAFALTQPASSVNSQATTTFDVTFDPAAGGTFTDTVTITNNDSDENPYTFVVSGTGLADTPISGLVASNSGPTTLGNATTLEANIAAGTNVSYVWALGDGTTLSGNPVSHTYTTAGSYTAIVTATNGSTVVTATTEVQINSMYTAYIPVIYNQFTSLPDLEVVDLTVTADDITITIQNTGLAPVVNGFWVDFYLNPTTPPTQANDVWQNAADSGAAWGIDGAALPLAPGETIVLTLNDSYYQPALSNLPASIPAGSTVYAHVDSANTGVTAGAILEADEQLGLPYNNILGPIISTAVVSVSD